MRFALFHFAAWLTATVTLSDAADEKCRDDSIADASCSATAALDENDANAEDQCTVYIAPSSIPGAGLGIFTAIDRNPGDDVGLVDR